MAIEIIQEKKINEKKETVYNQKKGLEQPIHTSKIETEGVIKEIGGVKEAEKLSEKTEKIDVLAEKISESFINYMENVMPIIIKHYLELAMKGDER